MTWTPTPVISVETVTGQVRTVTITPTAPSEQNANNLSATSTNHDLGTGQAVGLTIGLVAVVGIIGAVIFFCIRKRRQIAAEDDEPIRGDSASGQFPRRTVSENSRYMLGTDGRQVVEGWQPEPEMSVAGSRRSRLMPVDPRLDPFAPVYQQGSKSRESVHTIRDDHDYSRRVATGRPILRAVNPDE
jgi:cell wall integrity and stress response component